MSSVDDQQLQSPDDASSSKGKGDPKASGAPAKPSRTQTQGVQLLSLGLKSAKVAAMLLVVWLIGYVGLSVTWVLIALVCYVVGNEYSRNRETKRAYAKQAVIDEQKAILARVDELPSWVYFPDVERAEWLNKMIQQMWPYIGDFVKNLLKTSVEAAVNANLPDKLKPFHFEKIDLGDIPPRIGGVKVYIDKVKRDEILLDVEITYASDADMTVSVRGLNAGVKDILLHGTVRVVMKPLISQIPLVGGLTVFFLNQPKIDFDLTAAANFLDLPLLSTSLRTIISDQIANFLVLPNKLSIPLVENISLVELQFPLPAGIIRLTIVEATELIKADFGVLSKGKSDPYCKIYAGGQCLTTPVIHNSITPVWNETFEIIIDHKQGQDISIDVLDEDPGDDDELGSTEIDLDQVASAGSIDSWLQLDNVKSGRLHVKALWLYLSKNKEDVYKAKTCRGSDSHLSTAVLVVTVDSAKDLMCKTVKAGKRSISEPSPYVRLELGNREQKTLVKQKTTNPKWEQSFRFFVVDPELQDLLVEVFDTNKNNKKLGTCKVLLRQLLNAEDFTLNRPFSLKEADNECSITLRLALRLLTPDEPKEVVDEGEQLEGEDKQPEEHGTSVSKPSEKTSTGETSSAAESSKCVAAASESAASESRSDDNTVGGAFDDNDSSGLRYRGPVVPSDGRFGRIQVSIRYSDQRSKIVVVIHKCLKLIPCDDDNLSDPYVRVILLPDKSTKKKTQIQKNTLDPVFDETFDWPLSKADAALRILELMVKNSVGYFSKSRVNMGVVRLNLSEIDDLSNTVTEWYDLQNPDEVLKDS